MASVFSGSLSSVGIPHHPWVPELPKFEGAAIIRSRSLSVTARSGAIYTPKISCFISIGLKE
jgi:hypothetical protein